MKRFVTAYVGSSNVKLRRIMPSGKGTEPDAGSDLRAIKTTATRSADGFVLNGQKTFISNGQLADLIIVACKTLTTEDGGRNGISLLLVEGNRAGLTRANDTPYGSPG